MSCDFEVVRFKDIGNSISNLLKGQKLDEVDRQFICDEFANLVVENYVAIPVKCCGKILFTIRVRQSGCSKKHYYVEVIKNVENVEVVKDVEEDV